MSPKYDEKKYCNGSGPGSGSVKTAMSTYTWDEVKKHTKPDDKWIVIKGLIYNISKWQKHHPGGARIISHFVGQDATVGKLLQAYSFIINQF